MSGTKRQVLEESEEEVESKRFKMEKTAITLLTELSKKKVINLISRR
jgi:hypothetical protein